MEAETNIKGAVVGGGELGILGHDVLLGGGELRILGQDKTSGSVELSPRCRCRRLEIIAVDDNRSFCTEWRGRQR
jgi:hypothetical protein